MSAAREVAQGGSFLQQILLKLLVKFFEGMDITVNSLILGAATSSSASGYSGIILIILMIALMYFFMIRPQQKQRKQHQEMMNQLHRGDEVITIGRLHGKIDSVDQQNRTVTLDCEGIYLTFDMVAIARVVKPAAADKPAQKEAPAEEKATPAEDAAEKDNNEDDQPADNDQPAEDKKDTPEDNQEK